MYHRLTSLLLQWLRVPPEPHPPHGDPASLRVFRAGKNFLNLRLLKWGAAQLAALAGIIFWFGVFSDLDERVQQRRIQNDRSKPAATAPAPAAGNNAIERAVNTMVAEVQATAAEAKNEDQKSKKKQRIRTPLDIFRNWQHGMTTFFAHLPRPALFAIWFFEIAGLILYVLQLPITFLLARLDYDQRWYMVTDRSLRIRHGVWKISESTMSFANIQQVVVTQGPLQRLLGLSDVKVQSAGGGGGGGDPHEHHNRDDMHLGLFHSVTNGSEIRDLILERLRRFRESGLGDPEEKIAPAALSTPATVNPELLAAARELAAEARALRMSLG
jgi:membrane protein YdbS with pleckstrin-like domain